MTYQMAIQTGISLRDGKIFKNTDIFQYQYIERVLSKNSVYRTKYIDKSVVLLFASLKASGKKFL